MFGLFKKKKATIKIKDKVWMAASAKLKAFTAAWKKNPEIVFIFWFDESLQKTASHFSLEITEPAPLLAAREVQASLLSGKTVIFGEHYPLPEKENTLFQKLNLQEAVVWSALDEPLFKHFGGEKIIQMMKQLGMKEEEAVENTLISQAIRNAQEKISKKVILDQTSSSQQSWLQNNFPG